MNIIHFNYTWLCRHLHRIHLYTSYLSFIPIKQCIICFWDYNCANWQPAFVPYLFLLKISYTVYSAHTNNIKSVHQTKLCFREKREKLFVSREIFRRETLILSQILQVIFLCQLSSVFKVSHVLKPRLNDGNKNVHDVK